MARVLINGTREKRENQLGGNERETMPDLSGPFAVERRRPPLKNVSGL